MAYHVVCVSLALTMQLRSALSSLVIFLLLFPGAVISCEPPHLALSDISADQVILKHERNSGTTQSKQTQDAFLNGSKLEGSTA